MFRKQVNEQYFFTEIVPRTIAIAVSSVFPDVSQGVVMKAGMRMPVKKYYLFRTALLALGVIHFAENAKRHIDTAILTEALFEAECSLFAADKDGIYFSEGDIANLSDVLNDFIRIYIERREWLMTVTSLGGSRWSKAELHSQGVIAINDRLARLIHGETAYRRAEKRGEGMPDGIQNPCLQFDDGSEMLMAMGNYDQGYIRNRKNFTYVMS